MGSSLNRVAKQQPWYHEPLPRCITTTLAKNQCIFSARFMAKDNPLIVLCKMHADMADFPVKQIPPNRINLR